MGIPINPQFPTSVQTGQIPVYPNMQSYFRDYDEAYQAWLQSRLRGDNTPLSLYLGNIAPGAPGMAGVCGGGLPASLLEHLLGLF